MDIKAIVLRCSITLQCHTTAFQSLAFHGKEDEGLWKHDGWWAQHKKHDSNIEKEGGKHAGWEGTRVGGAYCTSSSSKFSSGAHFRGRPCWTCRPLLNSLSSTVQKDPNSSSTRTKHLCRERLVRMAPWESKPAWSWRKVGEGGGGRRGERANDAARCRCRAAEMKDKHTNRHKEEGKRITMKMSHFESWVTKRASKSISGKDEVRWEGGHAKVSRDFAHYGKQTIKLSSSGPAVAPPQFCQSSDETSQRGQTYPLIFWGRLFWNSISSTVHTAPLTFSTRTKHLWRLRLCRTAFCGWCKENKKRTTGIQQYIKTFWQKTDQTYIRKIKIQNKNL